ncbi:28S ribosomal protein S27 [Sarcoptes scabiei]|uniref:28S ribosomal protein S27, mitochondrial n=1 Tax=Sarcoptes scabiei TaxID=52283 RepID=A0A834R4F1_SARSC|nr:28S ribosomal protein S27 [Sarcoptes scabiei]
MSILNRFGGNLERKFVTKTLRLMRISSRTLLSPNYYCNEQWKNRIEQDETLRQISTERYFFELNQKFAQKKSVSAVDVDLFINSLELPESQDELEHILKKFRKTSRTTDTLESTHHAVCRFYLSHSKISDLLNILNNRIEYGIFPDLYTYNMLLNECILQEKFDQALDVVKLMMLQEDGGNEITKTLAMFVMTKFLNEIIDGKRNSIDPIQAEKKDENVEEDEEIEYIRVPYLTNSYFDDHFDLTDRNHIFGKSLHYFGEELLKTSTNDSDKLLARTSMIIGLIFFEKWDRANSLLQSFSETNASVSKDLILILKQLSHSIESEVIRKELDNILDRFSKFDKILDEKSIDELLSNRVRLLSEQEPEDIMQMGSLMENFKKIRIETLNDQMEQLIQRQRKLEIENQFADLERKKKLYYFFENFPKHEIDFARAEKRIKEIRSKTIVEEEYVPPENY